MAEPVLIECPACSATWFEDVDVWPGDELVREEYCTPCLMADEAEGWRP